MGRQITTVTIICITDIHGYLDRALESIRKLEKKTSLELLEEDKWISNHRLVVNGDAFDRGLQNREALEWVLENADKYLIGNHEFFALFPDIAQEFVSEKYIQNSTKKDLYWRNMDEEMRERLLKKAANGGLKTAFREYNYTYIHAGAENPDPEKLNSQLQKAGKILLEGFKEGKEAYKEAQKEIVWTVETENGTELRSKYPEIFEAKRRKEGLTGGAIWRRFNHLKTESAQIVGHTKGSYLNKKGYDYNPQRKGEAVNINTIRDSSETDIVALTLEDEKDLTIYELEIDEK